MTPSVSKVPRSKVFWSWQSDHPSRIGRGFVQKAIKQALKDLKNESDVEEAVREAEIDHDRKGVPGSPDLANTILKKIRRCQAFVADVTPVGQTSSEPAKKLTNPNVAIELGYALAVVTDQRMLFVLNEYFGTRDELPFDLKHKAGPIIYRLSPEATEGDIAEERIKLVGILKTALRDILASAATELQRTPVQRIKLQFGNMQGLIVRGSVPRHTGLNQPAMFIRGATIADGGTIRRCRVYVVRTEYENAGRFEQVEPYESVPLSWAHSEDAAVDITPSAPAHFCIAQARQGKSWFSQPDFPQAKFEKVGRYRLTIVAHAENADEEVEQVIVVWGGNWEGIRVE